MNLASERRSLRSPLALAPASPSLSLHLPKVTVASTPLEYTWLMLILDPSLLPKQLGTHRLYKRAPIQGFHFKTKLVQLSCSVMSNSLRPHESQHARPSLSITNSQSSLRFMSIESVMPSSHLILVIPFSSCPQSLPASESFPMSQLFTWGGQSTEVSALASFLPKKLQGWSPSEWSGWISLQSKGLSRVFSNTIIQKHQVR